MRKEKSTTTKVKRPPSLVVHVTQADIDAALAECSQDSPTLCPVGRAILREHQPDSYDVLHALVRVRVYPQNSRYYKTSQAMCRFISRFDAHKPVQPATFVLRRTA